MIITTRYEPIKHSKELKGLCPNCNKKKKITLSVEHTISPFNRNENDVPRSRSEVSQCVKEELAALVEFRSARFICATCHKGLNEKNWFGMTEYEFLKAKGLKK